MNIDLRKDGRPAQAVRHVESWLHLPRVLRIERDILDPGKDVDAGALVEVTRFSQKKIRQT